MQRFRQLRPVKIIYGAFLLLAKKKRGARAALRYTVMRLRGGEAAPEVCAAESGTNSCAPPCEEELMYRTTDGEAPCARGVFKAGNMTENLKAAARYICFFILFSAPFSSRDT